MTQQNKEKVSNIGLIIITFVLLAFLAGILGYEPYMKNRTPKEQQPEQINVQLEGENINGN